MTIRTLTATLTVGAVIAGAAAAPAMAQTATYPTDTAGQSAKKAKKAALRLTDAQQAVVAEELGVTVEALAKAIADTKTAIAATEERETRAEVDALLAGKLGVTVDALRDALAAARPARGERPARTDGAAYPSDGGERGGRGGGCGGGSGDGSGSYPSDGSGSYPSDGSGTYPSDT